MYFRHIDETILYKLNPDTGETLWQIDLPESFTLNNEIIRDYGDTIVVSVVKKTKSRKTSYPIPLRFLWGLNTETGEKLWEVTHKSHNFYKHPETGLLHGLGGLV